MQKQSYYYETKAKLVLESKKLLEATNLTNSISAAAA